MNKILESFGLTTRDSLAGAEEMNVGRVVIVHGDSADVMWLGDEGLEVTSRCAFVTALNMVPVAGDWVGVREGRVARVLARRSELRRPHPNGRDVQVLAANVDLVLIVVPVDLGLNARLLERLSIIARESGARPLVIVTKIDRASDPTSLKEQIESDDAGVEVVLTSSVTGEGIEELRDYLPLGVTAVMLGASGAGKTSLLNTLEGTDELTKDVGRDGEGRHATTTRKLYRLSSGGVLLDIPGIRLLEVMVDEEGLRLMFEDIEELALQCKFRNCHHRGDEGCAVELAVASGALSARRLETWREMQSEIENHERLRDPATARAQRKTARTSPKSS